MVREKEELKQKLIQAIRDSPVQPNSLRALADLLASGGSEERRDNLFKLVDGLFQRDSISLSTLTPPEVRKLKPVRSLLQEYQKAVGYKPEKDTSRGL